MDQIANFLLKISQFIHGETTSRELQDARLGSWIHGHSTDNPSGDVDS
jgi:hypothetical protein